MKKSSSMASPHVTYYSSPRISANELARFMVTGDTGRLGIIKRSREKRTSVAVRYSDVKDAISAAMCSPSTSKVLLASAYEVFQQKSRDTSLSVWSQEDSAKSLDVIDSFHAMKNQLAGYDFITAPTKQPALLIGGVSVAVSCDVIIHRPVKGVESVGAALFRLTKPDEEETATAKSKREQMGRYVSTLVMMQVSANLAGDRQPLSELCWSLDIQSGEIHKCPKNTKTLIGNIESACTFISAMWAKV
jgi:hypothetical protein